MWNGIPATKSTHAQIETKLDEDFLRIDFEAPWLKNPLPPDAPGSLMGLWEFEVIEIFFVGEAERYTEIEFGPGGHYLGLNFSKIREPWSEPLALEYQSGLKHNRWHGSACIERALLPTKLLSWNAYRIFNQGNKRVYMSAFPLKGVKPDFHRLDCFEICPWETE